MHPYLAFREIEMGSNINYINVVLEEYVDCCLYVKYKNFHHLLHNFLIVNYDEFFNSEPLKLDGGGGGGGIELIPLITM